MNFICVCSQFNIALLVFALPFGVAINVGPTSGIVALVLCVLFVSYNLYTGEDKERRRKISSHFICFYSFVFYF
jgi:hypothetical protein